MSDNVAFTPGSGVLLTADETTYSGDTAKVQVIRLVHVSGSEGAKTVSEVVGASGSPAAAAMTVQSLAYSTRHIVLAATTNATRVKNGAGWLAGLYAFSKRATPFYVRFHDTAADPPTAGSGVVLGFGVQAGIPLYVPVGRLFSTGIGVTVVAGIALTDANAVAAEDGEIVVFYV